MGIIYLVPFLIGLGVDLYVPSLPIIADYFHTKAALVQLTVSLYLLGYGVGQVILGVLSDSLGRKKIFLLSAFSFTGISFLCIWSPNIVILEIGRLLQGIAIAGLAVVSRAILVDLFSGEELAKASNYFTLSWSLGPIIAPFIGGNLEHYFGWQANFYLFAFYGLFLFIYAFSNLQETNGYVSTLNLSQVHTSLRNILTHRFFILITIISSLGYGVIVLFNIVGPFLLEMVLKYSVVQYGNIALILGLAYFLGATFNRLILSYFNSLTLLLFGLISSLIATILMIYSALIWGVNLLLVFLPTFLIFFFIGFIVPNALAQTMKLFPQNAGMASAVFGIVTGSLVFLITSFGSILKTNSQLPLSLAYLFLLILSLILFSLAGNEG